MAKPRPTKFNQALAEDPDYPDRLVSLAEVCERIGGIHRSTIWLYVKEGTFPRPIVLRGRRRLWSDREISAWIAAQKAARPVPPDFTKA